MDALEAIGREDVLGLIKRYIAGIGLSMVPVYLVADENAVLEPERMLATGIASILVPMFKLHEIYFQYVLRPTLEALKKQIGVKVGKTEYLSADYSLVVALLINGAVTAISARIMEEEGLAPKVLGALGGIVATTTTWKLVSITLEKEQNLFADIFPPK